MQDQRIEDDAHEDGLSEELRDNGVLNLFFCDPMLCPWSMDEIAREIENRLAAEDSVRRLTEAGLLHRIGGYVFPSRAARRANQLGVGSV
jgi:hypothetical protein